ncbi:MAG: hypothetical protein E7260_05630 [Lachnospiraceae bacterium]|nr:hypothetical protein [Lachnospiraceae bacterium]
MKIRSRFTDQKNGNMWYWDAGFSFPCVLNFKEKRVEIRGCDTYFDGYQVFCVDGELYFTSHANWAVMKYDAKSQAGHKYVFEGQREEKWFYSYTFQLEKRLYMVPTQITKYPIICFDTHTKQFSVDEGLKNKIKKIKIEMSEGEGKAVFPVMQDGLVWSAFCGSNCYFSYDLLTGDFREYFVREGISLYTMCRNEKMVCLTQSDTSEILIQYDNEETSIPVREEVLEKVYSRIIRLQSFFAVLPMNGRNLILIDTESAQVHRISVYPETEGNYGKARVLDCVEDEDRIYLLPWGAEDIYSVHKKTFEVQKEIVAYDKKQYFAKIIQRSYDRQRKELGGEKKPLLYEDGKKCSLEAFCAYVEHQRRS